MTNNGRNIRIWERVVRIAQFGNNIIIIDKNPLFRLISPNVLSKRVSSRFQDEV